jgi:hypothetical protein
MIESDVLVSLVESGYKFPPPEKRLSGGLCSAAAHCRLDKRYKGLFDDSESLYRAVASRSLDLQGDVVVSH